MARQPHLHVVWLGAGGVIPAADGVLATHTYMSSPACTLMFWGPPGVGKTAGVRSLAARAGRHIEVVVPGIREPSDIGGLPDVVTIGGRRASSSAMPAWAARLWQSHDAGRAGVLFVDEITTATPSMQAALLGLLLDGATDSWSLPPGTWRIAAANPVACSAGGFDLSAPAANRLVHRQWATPSPYEWAAGLMSGWSTPPRTLLDDPAVPGILGGVDDAASAARAAALVAGFVVARPALHSAMPREESARGGAWPSPRSWTSAATCIAAVLAAGGDIVMASEWVAGCVGESAAMEWLTWARSADLPDPEAVLAAGGQWTPPDRGDVCWAACAAIAEAARSKPSPARVEAALSALDKVAADIAAVHAGVVARAGLGAGWRPAGASAKALDRYEPLLAKRTRK